MLQCLIQVFYNGLQKPPEYASPVRGIRFRRVRMIGRATGRKFGAQFKRVGNQACSTDEQRFGERREKTNDESSSNQFHAFHCVPEDPCLHLESSSAEKQANCSATGLAGRRQRMRKRLGIDGQKLAGNPVENPRRDRT